MEKIQSQRKPLGERCFSFKLGRTYFLSLWWLWLLFLCISAVYLAFSAPIDHEIERMLKNKEQFLQEITYLEETVSSLQIRIQVQEDPRWQELVLIRQLNLVPSGWKKFVEED